MRDVSETEIETVWAKKQRRNHVSRFLKGPIPLTALQSAALMPGKTLALYLAIRHRADLTSTSTVSLPTRYLNDWGIDKDSKRRAIAALAQTGLIRIVDRRPGHAVRVALVVDQRDKATPPSETH